MKYLLLGLLLFSVLPSFAQIERAYLTAEGKYTRKPKKAASFVLIEKLEDSAYLVRQYDMYGIIEIQGTFKDEGMTVPNGKFLFYTRVRIDKNQQELGKQLNVDTNSYIRQVGYFLNGLSNGVWIRYSSKGEITSKMTFEKGKLNGLYQFFSSEYTYEGYYKNNLREGIWHSLRKPDSLLLYEAQYHMDTLKDYNNHWIPAKERDNLNGFLKKRLKKYAKQLVNNFPEIKYTINKEGRILSPEIIKGVSPEVDAALLSALADAPRYYPATYDFLPVEQNVMTTLYIYPYERYNNSFTYYNIPRYNGLNQARIYHFRVGNLIMTEREYNITGP